MLSKVDNLIFLTIWRKIVSATKKDNKCLHSIKLLTSDEAEFHCLIRINTFPEYPRQASSSKCIVVFVVLFLITSTYKIKC